MRELFIVAAGGTGAKVCEAFVHLCAAGLVGRRKVHILLVDGDNSLTRKRLEGLVSLYETLRQWPWTVKPEIPSGETIDLFGAEILLYKVADGFAPKNISDTVADDTDLRSAFASIFTEGELKNTLEKGFWGRPNLGSYVVAEYLLRQFESGEAAEFIVPAFRPMSPW